MDSARQRLGDASKRSKRARLSKRAISESARENKNSARHNYCSQPGRGRFGQLVLRLRARFAVSLFDLTKNRGGNSLAITRGNSECQAHKKHFYCRNCGRSGRADYDTCRRAGRLNRYPDIYEYRKTTVQISCDANNLSMLPNECKRSKNAGAATAKNGFRLARKHPSGTRFGAKDALLRFGSSSEPVKDLRIDKSTKDFSQKLIYFN